ncbi:MAG: hypothetical protein EBQ94_02035 [Flavobacteriales bacterium]|nr:hypothetical protein [Flavobacteriales bacterium]
MADTASWGEVVLIHKHHGHHQRQPQHIAAAGPEHDPDRKGAGQPDPQTVAPKRAQGGQGEGHGDVSRLRVGPGRCC